MTLDQGLAFGLIGVTVLLFIWGRLPYDLVALLSRWSPGWRWGWCRPRRPSTASPTTW